MEKMDQERFEKVMCRVIPELAAQPLLLDESYQAYLKYGDPVSTAVAADILDTTKGNLEFYRKKTSQQNNLKGPRFVKSGGIKYYLTDLIRFKLGLPQQQLETAA